MNFLIEHGELRQTELISYAEKLLIYISVLKGMSNRQTHEMWQHSGSTVSLIVDDISICFERVQGLLFVKPSLEVPAEILNNP